MVEVTVLVVVMRGGDDDDDVCVCGPHADVCVSVRIEMTRRSYYTPGHHATPSNCKHVHTHTHICAVGCQCLNNFKHIHTPVLAAGRQCLIYSTGTLKSN